MEMLQGRSYAEQYQAMVVMRDAANSIAEYIAHRMPNLVDTTLFNDVAAADADNEGVDSLTRYLDTDDITLSVNSKYTNEKLVAMANRFKDRLL
ncbi:hypothetical protein LY76DRAFT_245308 [Colletotrichum caudatum]|nr:hypothetical protein LY76DRAFT_245308 [Colletotrichum caudatum]